MGPARKIYKKNNRCVDACMQIKIIECISIDKISTTIVGFWVLDLAK